MTIYVSQGNKQYVGGTITELTGKDISSATFTVSLGSSPTVPPASGWVTADVNTAGATTASRILKMLLTNTTPLGTFWVWAQITDSPEIEPVVLQGPVIVA